MTTTAYAAAPAAATERIAARPRRDIQALRAVAVTLVVLSHFWPARIAGGYVGVDVFFVISGFLITSHLLNRPPRGARDLLAFWGRRIRRLLPAATLVLLVSLVASVMFLPATTLPRIAHETVAAATYTENWALARSATDYFAADDLHTPIQHYWSLSVEEQFYIVWPLLLGAALWLARRLRGRVPVVGIALGTVFVASLAYSVRDTVTNQAAAYFVTPTRMWELALGGLVALLALRGASVRQPFLQATLAWAGLVAIVVAALRFHADTPFPGVAALLPTLGAAAVIVASADAVRWSPDRLWSLRGVQLTGDISYSVYLWHWPLIVIVPFVVDHTLFWPAKVALIVTAFVLAWATKRLVEDPVRSNRHLSHPLWRTYILGALLMATTVAAATTVTVHENHVEAKAATTVSSGLTGKCVGAAATVDASCDFIGAKLLTPATFAKNDKSELYTDNCWNNQPLTTRKVCTFGSAHPSKRIALVGNSHAGYWEPALEKLATKNNWQITTYLVTECWTVDAEQDFGSPEESKNCQNTAHWQIEQAAKGDFDLIVVADRTNRKLVGVPDGQQQAQAKRLYGKTLDDWTAAGKNVLVMRDVPLHAFAVPDCVAEHPHDLSMCTTPQVKSTVPDPLAAAASTRTGRGVTVYDPTNRFCRAGTCYGVIGGVIAYFDSGHMSGTYSKTMAPYIEPTVLEALRR